MKLTMVFSWIFGYYCKSINFKKNKFFCPPINSNMPGVIVKYSLKLLNLLNIKSTNLGAFYI